MRGSRFDYRDPRIRIAPATREHGLDLPPPHQRNGGNWSLSIPMKTPPDGPPPPFLPPLAVSKHLYLFGRQILLAAFSFGLVVGIQVDTVAPDCPAVLGTRSPHLGPSRDLDLPKVFWTFRFSRCVI
jgi:hypothetical protein